MEKKMHLLTVTFDDGSEANVIVKHHHRLDTSNATRCLHYEDDAALPIDCNLSPISEWEHTQLITGDDGIDTVSFTALCNNAAVFKRFLLDRRTVSTKAMLRA